MPIKEEPIRIEFTYEQKNAKTSDGTFDVEYFSEMNGEDEKKYLSITPKGIDTPHIFEVDFFVEVVDFLRSKGVINAFEAEKEDITGSVLPLPKIQTSLVSPSPNFDPPTTTAIFKGQGVPISAYSMGQGIPVSAFTMTEQPPEVPEASNGLIPPVVSTSKGVISRPVPPTGSASPKIINSDASVSSDLINRKVIRTKVADNEDPIKALEESKRQRGTNLKKSIRRSEE